MFLHHTTLEGNHAAPAATMVPKSMSRIVARPADRGFTQAVQARGRPEEEQEIETGTGVVKWFNDNDGFGFLTFDDRKPTDIFVHITAVERAGFETLKKGDRFEFRIQHRHKDSKMFATHLNQI